MGITRFCAASIPILFGSTLCFGQTGGQNKDPETPVDTDLHWQSLAVIDARPKGRGLFGYAGESYSQLNGRKMELSELALGWGITNDVSIWYVKQHYLLLGHSVGRFRLGVDTYGAKWTFKHPTVADESAAALEFEIFRPGTAFASTSDSHGVSTENFESTQDYTVAFDYGTDHDLQMQLSYAKVQGAITGSADIVAFGVGRDLKLGPRIKDVQIRLQAQVVEQTYTDALETVDFELKPVVYGAIGWDMAKTVRLEGDGSLYPKGMPLADGRYTGLSSFQIYRPGGVAENLRSDTVAFASIRLMYHVKF